MLNPGEGTLSHNFPLGKNEYVLIQSGWGGISSG